MFEENVWSICRREWNLILTEHFVSSECGSLTCPCVNFWEWLISLRHQYTPCRTHRCSSCRICAALLVKLTSSAVCICSLAVQRLENNTLCLDEHSDSHVCQRINGKATIKCHAPSVVWKLYYVLKAPRKVRVSDLWISQPCERCGPKGQTWIRFLDILFSIRKIFQREMCNTDVRISDPSDVFVPPAYYTNLFFFHSKH